jgi:hypothetical protein
VQDSVGARDGVGDRAGVEQVELFAPAAPGRARRFLP